MGNTNTGWPQLSVAEVQSTIQQLSNKFREVTRNQGELFAQVHFFSVKATAHEHRTSQCSNQAPASTGVTKNPLAVREYTPRLWFSLVDLKSCTREIVFQNCVHGSLVWRLPKLFDLIAQLNIDTKPDSFVEGVWSDGETKLRYRANKCARGAPCELRCFVVSGVPTNSIWNLVELAGRILATRKLAELVWERGIPTLGVSVGDSWQYRFAWMSFLRETIFRCAAVTAARILQRPLVFGEGAWLDDDTDGRFVEPIEQGRVRDEEDKRGTWAIAEGWAELCIDAIEYLNNLISDGLDPSHTIEFKHISDAELHRIDKSNKRSLRVFDVPHVAQTAEDQATQDAVAHASGGAAGDCADDRQNILLQSKSGSVKLRESDLTACVNGIPKKLTSIQYRVVEELLQVSPNGLTNKAIEDKIDSPGGRSILKRLAKDKDWRKVIQFPGSGYSGGYKIP